MRSTLLGYRSDGRPFYGFYGAEGDEGGGEGDSGEGQSGSGSESGSGTGDEQELGERGQRAVAAERQATRAAKAETREWKGAAAEFGFRTVDDLRAALSKGASKPDQKDEAAIRREVEAEVSAKAARRMALSEVKAQAAGKFADPQDAVNHLQGEVDDLLGRDGEPDERAIGAALTDLLAAKPHWAAKPKVPNFDGGGRDTAPAPKTFGEAMKREVFRKKGITYDG